MGEFRRKTRAEIGDDFATGRLLRKPRVSQGRKIVREIPLRSRKSAILIVDIVSIIDPVS